MKLQRPKLNIGRDVEAPGSSKRRRERNKNLWFRGKENPREKEELVLCNSWGKSVEKYWFLLSLTESMLDTYGECHGDVIKFTATKNFGLRFVLTKIKLKRLLTKSSLKRLFLINFPFFYKDFSKKIFPQ